MMQRAIVDLPQPDSPTTPSVSPSLDGEADAVDRLHRGDLLLEDDPARDREVLLEVLDDEQLVAAHHGRRRPRRRLTRPHRSSGSSRASRSFVSWSRWHALEVRPARRRTGASSGRLVPADVHHVRAARVEAAAARRVEQRRRLARDLHEPLDVDVEPRQRAEQAPRVRVLRPLEDLVDRCPARRPRPAYMTTTSSAISATTPRSCVIMMIALPNSSCRLLHQRRGSAPASSRRARSSARRRSAGRGR